MIWILLSFILGVLVGIGLLSYELAKDLDFTFIRAFYISMLKVLGYMR